MLTNVQVIPIFWGQSWGDGGENSQWVQPIHEFFDWILNHSLMDMLCQDYSVDSKTIGYAGVDYIIGYGTRLTEVPWTAQNFVIADPNDAPPSSITDLMIQTKISDWINAGLIPDVSNEQQLYFIYIEGGVQVSDPNGYMSCEQMCGYHFSTSNALAKPIYYAVVPYPCLSNCFPTAHARTTSSPTILDALTAISSHELCEAITDPIPTIFGSAWYDYDNFECVNECCLPTQYGEIADICTERNCKCGTFQDIWLDEPTWTGVIQEIWSIHQNGCSYRPIPPTPLNLYQQALGTPALVSKNNDFPLFLAWTRLSDHHILTLKSDNPAVSGIGTPQFETPVDLGVTSVDGPALAWGPGGKLWIAWTDENHHINVSDLAGNNKQTLTFDSSSFGPAMAFHPVLNRLFIAYTASDGSGIYIISSQDGVNWDTRIGPPDNVALQISTDSPQYLSLPSLSFANERLYLLWRVPVDDIDPPPGSPWCNSGEQYYGYMFVRESTDGIHWGKLVNLSDKTYQSFINWSPFPPSLIQEGSDLFMAWGQDGLIISASVDVSLGSAGLADQWNYHGKKYYNTACTGIAVASYQGDPYAAWVDPSSNLNVMRLKYGFDTL